MSVVSQLIKRGSWDQETSRIKDHMAPKKGESDCAWRDEDGICTFTLRIVGEGCGGAMCYATGHTWGPRDAHEIEIGPSRLVETLKSPR